MIKTNHHTHTYLCGHAQGMPRDYIQLAIKANYKEIGISDHGPLFKEWTFRMSMDEFYNLYLPDIQLAQIDYSDKITIYKGLEIEYHPKYNNHYERLLKDLDYLILGQHVLITPYGFYDIYKNMTKELINLYKNEVIAAMKTGYFKILAHPEIFLFGYRKWNSFTESISREIIKVAAETNVLLEINANGIRRGKILDKNNIETYIYPRNEFLQLVNEYPQAKVIIGEDNHAFKHVDDKACYQARKYANDLNITPQIYLFE